MAKAISTIVLTGARKYVRQLRLLDAAGMQVVGQVLMTPDGRYYVYGGVRELGNLFVVTGLR